MYLISFPCYRINIPTTFNSIEADGTVVLWSKHIIIRNILANLLWDVVVSVK